MRRRSMLRAAGSAGVVGLSAGSGCLRSVARRIGGYGAESEWRHGVGGSVDGVAAGRVFGREDPDADGSKGAVFALDAETGRRQWRYGQSGGLRYFTHLTVEDAVYLGSGTDTRTNPYYEVTALEFDGQRRWSVASRSVREPPRVVDGVVYASSVTVRAIDAADGEVLWAVDAVEGAPTLSVASDSVYAAGERLACLDPADGSERWGYVDRDRTHLHATVVDGVAYVDSYDALAAVEGGERRWRTDVRGVIEAVASGAVIVRHDGRISAFSTADGRLAWQSAEFESSPGATVHGGVLYHGGDGLHAVDTDGWRELWRHEVGDGLPVEWLTVAGSSGEDEHSLYLVAGDDCVTEVGLDGDRRWTERLDEDVRSVHVDDRVFVGTDQHVYALDPSAGTPRSTG